MKKILGLLLLILCAVIFSVLKINVYAHQPLKVENDVLLEIKPGQGLYMLVDDLYKKNIISCKVCIQTHLYFKKSILIVPGEYVLSTGMSFEDFLQLLKKRAVLEYKVTLVEGLTLKQALHVIWKKQKIKRLLQTDDADEVLQQLDFLDAYKNKRNAEGLFFPATYHFQKGTTDIDVLKMAYEKMQKILDSEWQNRARNLPYKDAYEALIMASIVEKETGVAHEREDIAGVFVRRLQRGMLLQTDPTVIYGMGANYRGNIRRRDLLEKTPYNTYVIQGLPPTPIALPGLHSIQAALHPKNDSSLYFVADGNGGHVFSVSLAEHNRAVQRYVQKMRARR